MLKGKKFDAFTLKPQIKVLFIAFECPFKAFECAFRAFECPFRAFEQTFQKHERRFFNKRQNKFIRNRKQMRSAKITTHGYRGAE